MQVRELGGSSAFSPSSMNHWPGIETEDPARGWVEPVWGETTYTPYIFIFIYTWSLHYLCLWGRLQNTSFLGTFDTCWGLFHAKKAFYLPSRCWLYTLIKHYQAKSCERFMLVLSDVGSGTLTHHSDPGA